MHPRETTDSCLHLEQEETPPPLPGLQSHFPTP